MRTRISILTLLILGLILTGLPPGWAQTDPPAVVTVPDAALRAVLEDSLYLAAGAPIMAAELAKLTELEAPDVGIVDLMGLEHATGLTRLDLGPGATRDPWANTNAVSDLSPLSSLNSLTWLDLAGNSVVDVTPLAGLTGLTHLNLEVNRISDIASLAGLTNLTRLYLAFNHPKLLVGEAPVGFGDLHPDLVIVTFLSGPHLFPNLLSSLNHIVYAYRDALARGRVTSHVAPGPCAWEFARAEFRTWDISMPAPSIPVNVQTETAEDIDTVSNYLQTHGITRVRSWKGGSEDAIKGRQLLACVPVPLLVSLSELPGVLVVRLRGGVTELLPTGVRSTSWGRAKRLRQ